MLASLVTSRPALAGGPKFSGGGDALPRADTEPSGLQELLKLHARPLIRPYGSDRRRCSNSVLAAHHCPDTFNNVAETVPNSVAGPPSSRILFCDSLLAVSQAIFVECPSAIGEHAAVGSVTSWKTWESPFASPFNASNTNGYEG